MIPIHHSCAIGTKVKTRSGGAEMILVGWTAHQLARCQLGSRIYNLPADLLMMAGSEVSRPRRSGRPAKRLGSG